MEIGNDTIDTRDLIERYDELVLEWEEATGDTLADYVVSVDDLAAGLSYEDAEELFALREFIDDYSKSIEDFDFGATLILDQYFEQYVQEFARDIGGEIPDWIVVDWEQTAENVQMDYQEVTLGSETYWVR